MEADSGSETLIVKSAPLASSPCFAPFRLCDRHHLLNLSPVFSCANHTLLSGLLGKPTI